MAQPVFYQTLSMVGIDPTLYYTNIATAGGSVTPEFPAPPFLPGTQAFGSDGSQFVFVQASTSISLSDFVVISAGNTVNPFLANSITTTNAGVLATEVNMAVGATGLILKQSVSFIPANALFWACTKGDFIPATTSGTGSSGITSGTQVILYTTAQAGQLTTIATVAISNSAANVAFAGFNVVSSVSISIPASVVPPVGTLTSTGFTQGPVVSMNNPRTTVLTTGLAGTFSSAQVYW